MVLKVFVELIFTDLVRKFLKKTVGMKMIVLSSECQMEEFILYMKEINYEKVFITSYL
jgi:hypothetical protein